MKLCYESRKHLEFIIIARNKFLKPNYTFRRVLIDKEKFEFVKTFASWIEKRDIIDNCFVLNFGYVAPFPWPQVDINAFVHKSLQI